MNNPAEAGASRCLLCGRSSRPLDCCLTVNDAVMAHDGCHVVDVFVAAWDFPYKNLQKQWGSYKMIRRCWVYFLSFSYVFILCHRCYEKQVKIGSPINSQCLPRSLVATWMGMFSHDLHKSTHLVTNCRRTGENGNVDARGTYLLMRAR